MLRACFLTLLAFWTWTSRCLLLLLGLYALDLPFWMARPFAHVCLHVLTSATVLHPLLTTPVLYVAGHLAALLALTSALLALHCVYAEGLAATLGGFAWALGDLMVFGVEGGPDDADEAALLPSNTLVHWPPPLDVPDAIMAVCRKALNPHAVDSSQPKPVVVKRDAAWPLADGHRRGPGRIRVPHLASDHASARRHAARLDVRLRLARAVARRHPRTTDAPSHPAPLH